MIRRVDKNYNTQILEWLSARPIAFNPFLAKISGKATFGLFMSQLLYWWEKGKNEDWIYKTIEEFQDETTLSRSEQDTAIKRWKKLGVLEVKNKGIPAKRHFKIDIDKLLDLLELYRTDPISYFTAWEYKKEIRDKRGLCKIQQGSLQNSAN